MERPRRRLVITLVLAVLALVLGGGLVWIRMDLAAARAAAEEREAALRAAGVHAVSLLSIDHRTVDQDLKRILSTSTGAAREAYAKEAPARRKATLDHKVTQTGVVRSAGLVAMNGDRTAADVLVVADALIRWEGAKDAPEERFYRWTMRVSKVGSAWLVEKAEQVP
jgi:Mce-associated membrane protein